ncbi:MAG: hypothetical protein R3245_05720, partial [Kiloniellales bacterium]|nr:hypothetical protein [Kiloniellales bacterium]
MEYVNATIDQVTDFLVKFSGDSGALVFIVIFAAVFAMVVAVGLLLSGRSPVERRLAGQAASDLVSQ